MWLQPRLEASQGFGCGSPGRRVTNSLLKKHHVGLSEHILATVQLKLDFILLYGGPVMWSLCLGF